MKMLLNLFLLVGMSPGTFLPSFITDQLLAPAAIQAVSKSSAAEKDSDEDSSRSEDADPTQAPPSILVVPSTYSAIRPTGFQFTKGDIRTILALQECRMPKIFVLFDFTTPGRNGLPLHSRIMELDYCDAHEAAVTFPEIYAHAPPAYS